MLQMKKVCALCATLISKEKKRKSLKYQINKVTVIIEMKTKKKLCKIFKIKK